MEDAATLVGLDEDTLALAGRIGDAAEGVDGVTVIYACCWVLADLTLAAERMKGRPSDESLILIMRQLVQTVEALRTVITDQEIRH